MAVKVFGRRDRGAISCECVVITLFEHQREIGRKYVVGISDDEILDKNRQRRVLGCGQWLHESDEHRGIVDWCHGDQEIKNRAVGEAVVDGHGHGQGTVEVQRRRYSIAIIATADVIHAILNT